MEITLDSKHKNHTLSGDYECCHECRIKPDWLPRSFIRFEMELLYLSVLEHTAIYFRWWDENKAHTSRKASRFTRGMQAKLQEVSGTKGMTISTLGRIEADDDVRVGYQDIATLARPTMCQRIVSAALLKTGSTEISRSTLFFFQTMPLKFWKAKKSTTGW